MGDVHNLRPNPGGGAAADCPCCGLNAARMEYEIHRANSAVWWAQRLEAALRTIRGPEDRGEWIDIYRAAGGGYEGLQAIASAALEGKQQT